MYKKILLRMVFTCLIIFLITGFLGPEEAFAEDFMEIVRKGSLSEIREMLEEDIDINMENEKGETPLILAAAHNRDPGVIDLLLDEGAVMERRDNRGKNALYHAAAYNDNIRVMRRLLARGAALNVTTNAGYSPLLRVAEQGKMDRVDLLVDYGARVNQRCPDGETALMKIIKRDASRFMVRRMINAGASVRVRDNQGRSPLHLAASKEREDIARILIDRRAEVDAADDSGITPLMEAAAENRNKDVISLLLESGANLEKECRQGKTPFIHAVKQNRNMKPLEYLLERGADFYATDDNGKGALHHAVTADAARAKINLLMEKDIEVDRRDRDDNTPLHLATAVRRPDPGILRTLLQAGANPNLKNGDGYTPLLFLAKTSDREELFHILIKNGADVNLAGRRDITPLMLAAENTSNEEVIFTLIDAGAEVASVRDARGRKVVDYLEGNKDLLDTDAFWELQYMEPAERQLEKLEMKSSFSGTVRSLALPSLGHAYAESWWPKGALFLAGEATALGLALTRDDSSDALPFYIAFAALKALEVYDVNREISSFNEMAEGFNERVEEFNRRFIEEQDDEE